MKRELFFIAPLFFLIINAAHTYGQLCQPKPQGWTVNICVPRTEAKGVNLWIGPGGGDEGTRRFWKTWHKGDPTDFPVPTYLLFAKEIWMKVETLEEDKNVNVRTLFNGRTTKNWETDGRIDDETSRTDTGDCKCD